MALSSAPPAGFIRAVVTRRDDVTDDLAVFTIRPDRPVRVLPGQYVTLALRDAVGALVKRPYSVVSAPHEAELELYVEYVEKGALTPHLFSLYEGGEVWIREKAAGRFLLDAARAYHVMACTVTGIAPFLSMIRAQQDGSLDSNQRENHFLVLLGASHAVEFGPYAEELMLRSGTRLTAVATVSRPWTEAGWTGEVGRVEDVLRKHFDQAGWKAGDTAGYACGNPQMVENVQGVLARAGLAGKHIHEEKYFTEPSEPLAIDPAPVALPKRPSGKLPGEVTLKKIPS